MDEIECYLGRVLDPESSGFATDLHGFTKGLTLVRRWGTSRGERSVIPPTKSVLIRSVIRVNPWLSSF